jgi:hypothetical protein
VFVSQEPASRTGKEDTEDDDNKSVLQEFMEFVIGSLRAVLNLGRAYRRSVASGDSLRASSNALDCIWTLYCRNLDKTARLHGPYGFLAKMNRCVSWVGGLNVISFVLTSIQEKL